MKPLIIGYFPIGRIHFDADSAQKNADGMYQNLQSAGFEVIGKTKVSWDIDELSDLLSNLPLDDIDAILVFNTTFTDSTMVISIGQKIKSPLILWSIPEAWDGGRLRLNSFTGMNLAAHALKQNGIAYSYIHSDVDDLDSYQQVKRIATAGRVIRDLAQTKIGVIGKCPEGFETCQFSRGQVKRVFGIDVDEIPIHEFFERVKRIAAADIQITKADLIPRLAGLEKLEQSALDRSIAIYHAFLELGNENQYTGLAIRCWPEFFTEMNCSACGALALANEAGLPCSCEVDVFGLITQVVLGNASSHSAIGVDLIGFDFDKNRAAVWHCGLAPINMANPTYKVEAIVHSNRGLPLLLQFPFKPGKITIARLHQIDGHIKLVLSRGEMLDEPRPFAGTCGVLVFENHASDVYEEIMQIGLEHHIAFTYGDVYKEMEVIAKLLEIPIINL